MQSVAVLVDGDNVSGKYAKQILSIASKHGKPNVARVYTDAQCPSEWHNAHAYRLLHAGTGKNAADILLALDAMEMLLTANQRLFVIASSDGDFTHLATRLREHGATVIGVGEAKAPKSFRACCAHFVEIGKPLPVQLVQQCSAHVSDLDLKIRKVIASHSEKGAGMRFAELGPKIHRQHGIRISTLPEQSWRTYLAARPSLFDLDPRGPDAMVRYLAEGFAQTA